MARPDIVDAINATAQDLVMEYGDTGHAAAAMAGVPYEKGVSKNKEYRTAQRNLQRYLKGRTPLPDAQLKMNRARNRGKGNKINFSGRIMVNGYERERTISQSYSAHEWDELSQLAAAGDEEGLWEQIAHWYNVDEMEVLDGDIDIG